MTYLVKDEKSGTLDEIIHIRAAAGKVELTLDMGGQAGLTSGSITIVMPALGVNLFIKKLEAARDAAALMASSAS